MKKFKLLVLFIITFMFGTVVDASSVSVKVSSNSVTNGSSVTVTASINADLYENWTDVSGFLMADPRIVNNPQKITTITYRELRELSYMGASVLHEEAVFPVTSDPPLENVTILSFLSEP